jgi:excisionase family DNA binding protein
MNSFLTYKKASPSQGVEMLGTTSPRLQRHAASAKTLNVAERRNLNSEPETRDSAVTALLTESEVSRVLRVSLATLRKWRVEKRGPRFIKIGPLVRYQLEDLREWLSALPTGGMAISPAAGDKHRT